jgi:hypothetical protein
MFHVPNKYRVKDHPILGSDDSIGNNGAFVMPFGYFNRGEQAIIIASDGSGWEHVSIHIAAKNTQRTPTWDEMCRIKDIFWNEEDCVVQYHPPKSEYVNQHKHTLHLWRPTEIKLPMPDSILVGIKK